MGKTFDNAPLQGVNVRAANIYHFMKDEELKKAGHYVDSVSSWLEVGSLTATESVRISQAQYLFRIGESVHCAIRALLTFLLIQRGQSRDVSMRRKACRW